MLKFFAEKMWVPVATHIFSAKIIRILYIESAKTVNQMTLYELIKLTTLWPRCMQESKTIKALTALMGQLSLSEGWENGPELGLKTVSFNL